MLWCQHGAQLISQTAVLIPILSRINPKDASLLPPLPEPTSDPDLEAEDMFDPETAYTLITPTRILTLETRFKRDADAAYVEAKRSMVSSIAAVPLWMYGALAFLGWNEAMAVLFNPVYFALVLILGASA